MRFPKTNAQQGSVRFSHETVIPILYNHRLPLPVSTHRRPAPPVSVLIVVTVRTYLSDANDICASWGRTLRVYIALIESHKTAVPFWGQTTRNLTGLSPKTGLRF